MTDIKRILPEVEFYKLCDQKIINYVNGSKEYHGCYSPDYDKIF